MRIPLCPKDQVPHTSRCPAPTTLPSPCPRAPGAPEKPRSASSPQLPLSSRSTFHALLPSFPYDFLIAGSGVFWVYSPPAPRESRPLLSNHPSAAFRAALRTPSRAQLLSSRVPELSAPPGRGVPTRGSVVSLPSHTPTQTAPCQSPRSPTVPSMRTPLAARTLSPGSRGSPWRRHTRTVPGCATPRPRGPAAPVPWPW